MSRNSVNYDISIRSGQVKGSEFDKMETSSANQNREKVKLEGKSETFCYNFIEISQ